MCIDVMEICFGIAKWQISSNIDRVIQDWPIFSFLDDNLSKCQGILTEVGTCTCIDIKEIWLGLLMGKFRQLLTELSARDIIMAGYYCFTFLFVN